jgi:hypothetical protein
MTIVRRFLLIAILPMLLISAHAVRAQAAWSWDGTWTGTLGPANPWPMSITITQGKVVSYTLKGTRFDVQYSKISPTTVSFGDRDNYVVKLRKTGDATASARTHGHISNGTASLTKQ